MKEKKPTTKGNKSSKGESSASEKIEHLRCALPEVAERTFGPDVNPNRASLILRSDKKWVNGTILHYYFFDRDTDGETVYFSDGTSEWRTWTAADSQKRVVRKAFDVWKDVGIGLEFTEVNSRDDAEIRIAFQRGDGSWSYIGRDILSIDIGDRTMNLGWDLTGRINGIDTAVHEIGHTLGFPHEHQNPNAGIEWDEEAVYRALAQPPNRWSREKTHYNIIRKIQPDLVQGSNWDPDSIMHYPFEAGLIEEPAQYRNGIYPEPGLSDRDKSWVRQFYPPLGDDDYMKLKPFESVPMSINMGEQMNFVIEPDATRYYDISTFGTSDTVMVLFEDEGGDLKYRTGDDDSGENYNANLHVKLFKGRRYVLRIRLYYSYISGETVVMIW